MPLHVILASWLLFGAPASHSGERVENRRVGVWTVRTSTDAFTGARSCRLFSARMDYGRGAVVFHFPRNTDTSAAIYRVDGGPPVAASSELMDMARRGFAVYDDRLGNPSGGVVRVPQARLIDARIVSIRPNAKVKVSTFKIDGLSAALALVRSTGCPSDVSDAQRSP